MNERAVKGIVVDAGHGGNDPGAVANGLKEKDLTLQAATYMYDRLRELGIPATLVRNTDETVERDERVKRILDAYGNDPNVIVVSNHINAGGGEGAEVIYALRNNSTLSREVLESIGAQGQTMRKYYQRRLPEDPMKDYYFIHRLTGKTQPILVEYGFIDNTKDSEKLKNDIEDYVEGVVKALAEYGGYKYIPPAGSGEYYTVQRNDSLWSIANKFNTTVTELRRLNNLTSDTLQIGQLLKVKEETSTPTPPEPPSDNTYIVQRNDSLWSIANKFNTTVAKLRQLNNLTSDVLQIGQVLRVREESEETPPTENTYVVASGDSLWSIANKFNVSVDELKRINNLSSNLLQIGQVLIIPVEDEEEPPTTNKTLYIVKSGDSLWSIATKYGLTVDELIKENNLTSNVLSIGQELIIPGKSQLVYTVSRGDSLWTIANQFGTTVDKIKEKNGLSSNILNIGQQLIIPN